MNKLAELIDVLNCVALGAFDLQPDDLEPLIEACNKSIGQIDGFAYQLALTLDQMRSTETLNNGEHPPNK